MGGLRENKFRLNTEPLIWKVCFLLLPWHRRRTSCRHKFKFFSFASLREKWLNLTGLGSKLKHHLTVVLKIKHHGSLPIMCITSESFRSELQRRFKGRALKRIYYWGEGSVKDLLLRRGLLNTGTRPSLVDDWSRLQILYRANPKLSSLQLCNTCQIVDLKKLSIRFW